MAFLQPLILLALPFIGLPIVIHLLNQRRHKSIPWGAMLFIRRARRMSKGVAKLRYWLIMLLRMLAVAGLIFAISRPLSSGWMGLSAGGGSKRTTMILLDRSPSMGYQDTQSGVSKRATALARLEDMFHKTGSGTDRVLIESDTCTPIRLEPGTALSELHETGPSSASADIPDMMLAALEYLKVNDIGTADIWVCSDLQQSDWDSTSGLWQQLRDEFSQFQAVRFLLLSYPDQTETNLAVSVENVHQRQGNHTSELVMDVKVAQTSGELEKRTIPLAFEISGVSTTVELEISGRQSAISGLTIPMDSKITSGAGRVELPGDANPADNVFQFAFAEPPELKTVVVSNDERVGQLLRLAASTPSNVELSYACTTLPPLRVNEIDWQETALVLWHAPMPTGLVARQLKDFVDSGRTVIFFPDDSSAISETDQAGFYGADWGAWKDVENATGALVDRWRTDSDLLQNFSEGGALPVGKLNVYRFCEIKNSAGTPLATLQDGSPLMVRIPSERGAVYFCATLPLESHSALAREGITLFVMIQRAIQQGSQSVGAAISVVAGTGVPKDIADWKPASKADEKILLSERRFQTGAFQKDGYHVAINRSALEDLPEVLSEEQVENVLNGLSFKVIDDKIGELSSLADEIWRVFVIGMIAALILEAVMSLPARADNGEAGRKSDASMFPDVA